SRARPDVPAGCSPCPNLGDDPLGKRLGDTAFPSRHLTFCARLLALVLGFSLLT
ncbi:hypothetical protein CHS0354_039801, partial [Potamilus streckersoni]